MNRWSRTKIMVYSFVVIPYLIAFFSVVTFTAMRLIVGAPPSIHSALETISRGSETERWQSALDLVSMLRSLEDVNLDQGFVNNLIFEHQRAAGERKPYLRTYLTLAMGLTQDRRFEEALLDGLTNEDLPHRIAAIKSLGLVGGEKSVKALQVLLNDSEPQIVLESVVALGRMGRVTAVESLLPLLEHPEPNVRWDTAISLAKLHDRTGISVINQLLDRNYLIQFPAVDVNEQDNTILVAIEIAGILGDPLFKNNLITLRNSEDNLKIANAAMMVLKKVGS